MPLSTTEIKEEAVSVALTSCRAWSMFTNGVASMMLIMRKCVIHVQLTTIEVSEEVASVLLRS
jgi:hypothetical protein